MEKYFLYVYVVTSYVLVKKLLSNAKGRTISSAVVCLLLLRL